MATKFQDGAIVRHIRTGNHYRVIFTPERGLMRSDEGEWLPCYVYRRELEHNGPIFTRDQAKFEVNFETI